MRQEEAPRKNILDMRYGVSLICRNEDEQIEACIDSIYSQTIKPEQVVIIDDGSTDLTPYLVFKKSKQYPNLYFKSIKTTRYDIKGWNISNAINISLKKLLELCNAPYIMRMDSDLELDNPKFVEILLMELYSNPKIGIIGGVSDKDKLMYRHVTDAARIYNRKCLEMLIEKTQTKNYPIMYGHDSYMIFRARWLGWEVKQTDIKFKDVRPYKRNLRRWFLTGRFRYMNGFTFIHAFFTTIRYMRQTPYIIGSLVAFFVWIVSHLMPSHKFLDKSYYDFMKKDLNQIIIFGLKNIFKKDSVRRLIY